MTFSELLNEWFELKNAGPDETSGYTDKAHYRRVHELEEAMNKLVRGEP